MLLIGPPGSGKTARILERVERAIRGDRSAEVQLLVPTTSMKLHVLNVLARRRLMVPARTVKTMSELVREATPGAREAQGAVQERLLREAIERTAATAFGPQSGSAGLRQRVAALAGEFWAAGADSFQVEPAVRTRRQRAFLQVFRAYEESLASSGFVHHNQRIALAAARIRGEGLDTVRTVLVDGFDLFTRQQEELLEALAEQSEEIVVALPEGLPRYPLRQQRHELLPPSGDARCATEVVRAPTPRAEVLEIARRILASGRPLREHAVIVRAPETYDAILREVFESLRIPFRNWGRAPLAEHGVARHFARWLGAIEQGFPGEGVLAALASPLTPARCQARLDAFDFAVRERLPNAGLSFLLDVARKFPEQARLIESLRECETWPRRRCGAARWAEDCLRLAQRVQELAPPVDAASFQRTSDWREAVAASKALRRAVGDTASLPEFEGRRIDFGAFAEALHDTLRAASLSFRDQRYEVVHVLPALEARQWSVPVAFVCGLAEGWFPRHFSQDVLFDDEDRKQLQARGIEMRTTADRAASERFLFEIATTRASETLVLSYPLCDSLGKPLVRSGLLGESEARPAPWVRLGGPAAPESGRLAASLPPGLRPAVAACNEWFSVSGIQRFRQCPYLYFSGHTLRLRGRPPLPERRLDSAALGTIVHDTLERWNRERSGIGAILDERFRNWMEEHHLPDSFRTESRRAALKADLERFAREQGASLQAYVGSQAFFEVSKSLRIEALDTSPEVRCRIDRFDLDDSRGCVVTDYKYARPDRIKAMLKEHLEGEQLQLMLYLAALEQELQCEPSGMALCGLRGQTSFEGVAVDGTGGLKPLERDELRALIAAARSEAAGAIAGILEGTIAVLPRDKDFCGRFCSFGDMCRVRWQPTEAAGSETGAADR